METIEQILQLAKTHHQANEFEAAEAAYHRILAQSSDHVEALFGLGLILRQMNRNSEAYDLLKNASVTSPLAEVYRCNMAGDTAFQLRRVDEALQWYDRALAIRTDWPEPHLNKAIALLTIGDWERGFPEFEWRWHVAAWDTKPIQFAQPRWDGGDLSGRTLLLWAEQGLGDMIQLVRYAPVLARSGANVIVGCQPPLKTLLQGVEGVQHVALGVSDTPPFDVHLPMFSLPLLMGVTPQNIPASVPYITADADSADQWLPHIKNTGRRLNIGLVWAGGPAHRGDRGRSIPLSTFAPLTQVADVAWFSLQKGPAAQQAAAPPPGMQLIDWTEHLSDLSATAALLAGLDLVITVDTAVAHLAGAMGKPVWNLLSYVADWRWMLDHTDTPWYPTMRLFRQSSPGDWTTVIQNVAAALAMI